MSQNTQVLDYLKQGKSITPIGALKMFSCFRLAARISDLRDMGYKVTTTIVEFNGKRFASYSLKVGK